VGQRVAIYCRVSTSDQSCHRQERDLLEFATRAGYDVVGVWKETGSGIRLDRVERTAVMALAQARRIDTILVTELSRWGRSTIDLVHTLQTLQAWNVSLIALNGMQFDLTTPQGRLIASLMASLAEFERDRLAPRVVALVEEGLSYRTIARHLSISKNTVTDIIKRHRTGPAGPEQGTQHGP
jgi:putative DNA-invertase from lambdoid prophage Rac